MSDYRLKVICLAAAMAVAVPVHAAELQPVRVSVLPIADTAPIHAAVAQGYFEGEGLKVELVTSTGGAAAMPALVSGALDVTYSNIVTAVLAKSQGLNIKIIAPGTATRMERSGLIVRRADNIKSSSDLENRVIAVNTLNNTNWLYLRAWLKQTGADPDKITYREVPFPQMNDALRQKHVAGIYIVDPFQQQAVEDPAFRRVANPNEIQPDVITGAYIVSDAFLDRDHGKTIEKFLRALQKGTEWFNAHIGKPEMAALLSKYSRMPQAAVEKLVLGKSSLDINVGSVGKTIALMREHRLLDTDIDPKSVVYLRK